MAARAIWKGELKIGTTRIPVKLYSGVTKLVDLNNKACSRFALIAGEGARGPGCLALSLLVR